MTQSTYQFGSFGSLESLRNASSIELAARFGYGAKGLVYALVGVLSFMAVMGFARGEITGTRGAIDWLNQASWGPLVLALITLGLFGFALWRAVQAIKDPEDKGSDAVGLARRTGLLISGGIYFSLALYASKLLLDMNQSGTSADQRASEVMAQDGGTLFIGLLGAAVIGVGAYQVYRAVAARFKENWKTGEMSESEERTATWISRAGIGARGVAFCLIGGFLAWGAYSGQPDKAQGMSGMLSELAQQPMGQFLVGAAATGLVCYGVYCFINALFRQIRAE